MSNLLKSAIANRKFVTKLNGYTVALHTKTHKVMIFYDINDRYSLSIYGRRRFLTVAEALEQIRTLPKFDGTNRVRQTRPSTKRKYKKNTQTSGKKKYKRARCVAHVGGYAICKNPKGGYGLKLSKGDYYYAKGTPKFTALGEAKDWALAHPRSKSSIVSEAAQRLGKRCKSTRLEQIRIPKSSEAEKIRHAKILRDVPRLVDFLESIEAITEDALAIYALRYWIARLKS